jgi:anti-sigma factor RsiW
MHPSEGKLIAFVLAESGDEERRRIEAHLAEDCPACAETVARLRELVGLMQGDRTPEPPAAWVQRAVALGRTSWREKIREWCGDLSEELGRLVFDSFAAPGLAPAGVRNVETERRMRFESGDVELDVRVEPTGRGGLVTGQFLLLGESPCPLPSARYLLTAGASEAVSGATDDFGEFSEQVPDLAGLRIRVIHEGRLAAFEIPEPATGD